MEPYASTLERFAANSSSSPGVELIYTCHPSWPLVPESSRDDGNYGWSKIASRGVELTWLAPGPPLGRTLALSVLDSSFNPPTVAHLALAHLPSSVTGSADDGNSSARLDTFDSKLLLFSIKNADKTPKPGDATPSQRLQMMVLLARELQRIGEQRGDRGSQNVAVAVCQEPTFVGKSAALKRFLHERMAALSPPIPVQLTFLIGFDTLERLFAPRYYGSESAMEDALRQFFSAAGDDCRILCARRSSGASYSQVDCSVLDAAAEYIASGSVMLTDIGSAERTFSSRGVRESIWNASDGWQHEVPTAIVSYIRENHLYAQTEGHH